MNNERLDRLYNLLPVIYRMRDVEQGEPLRALLQVIAEQLNLVEDDIHQLYENCFIETCEDWVVPYLGELIGYQPIHEAGEPSPGTTAQGRLRNKVLIPRREVANTIRYRRRKGTLALLELLSNDVAGWPARAVEFYRLLAWTQSLKHLHLDRAQTVDVRKANALELLDSPFDAFVHSVDVRRINSQRTQGRHNIPSVGVFIWRLKSYSVTRTPAYCLESVASHCYSFSVLGHDSPLYMNPQTEAEPTHIAEEFNLPVAIRGRLFKQKTAHLYGEGKSIQIWVGKKRGKKIIPEPLALEKVIPADLTDWKYVPRRGMVAVDVERGRMAFPSRQCPKNGVWVSYHYGFGMDMGGGEYDRLIAQQQQAEIYNVGKNAEYVSITKALVKWESDGHEHAVINITDSGVYVEQINVLFKKGQKTLQLRADNNCRPIIRLLDWQTDCPDSLYVSGVTGSCFILDGLLVSGRGVQVGGDLAELSIQHTTLVPGWTLDCDCKPQRSTEPSLEIFSPHVCVKIQHSIVGSIQLNPTPIEIEQNIEGGEKDQMSDDVVMESAQCPDNEVRLQPIRICISDSIVDASDVELEAIGAPGCPVAYACLTIVRSTVIGHIQLHAIELGENSIFFGQITVARRQKGCLRFSYVSPDSRTPRRYRCQPDLVEKIVEEALIKDAEESGDPPPDQLKIQLMKQFEAKRVRPLFNSIRYGTPTYCQLAMCSADEIKRGADDESEMGVFHDLFQPQRMANLQVRLDEYLPARMDIGIIVSS